MNHITGDIHYVALGLPRGRTILTVHDLNDLDRLRGVRRAVFELLYFRLPLRRSRFVTAVSEHTRRRLTELYPFLGDKVVVIPDCVPEGFEARPKPFKSDCPEILQVGTQSHKNVERVAAALSGVRCLLHVVGRLDGRQRQALDLAGVRCRNSYDLSDREVVRAYEEADAVVFASLQEGFGMPIIEAQAVGRALITSDVSPMREVAGGGACFVNPLDVASIRAGIRRVIDDQPYRESLVDAGFKNVRQYTAESVASQYLRLYERVAPSAL